ncbi:MAG TPA: nascent polypeptide-associated complex protein [Candidatus Nanoarchaeia archaeon]|nr:nascent polypeptide-associated complex protein [Candidatus Nanoarchaeia archaeon]
MFGGVNPKQVQALMKQMGLKQEEIEADRVIIEQGDKRIVIEPANVQKITMQGQTSWQITGESREETKAVEFSAEDVELVMEKTGKSKKEVEKVLKETKDIASAIVQLSE